MAKVRNAHTVCSAFEIEPKQLELLGVLNATLALDTKLFIDPLMLAKSSHIEINTDAANDYTSHFETVIAFLANTQSDQDIAWRTARRLLQFHEIKGTCLGYGAASIQGSGFGAQLTEQMLKVGKEIVDFGIRDPNLFPAMAIFEADIGPDRISDMTTNIIRKALIAFNRRILKSLRLSGERFQVLEDEGFFLRNPYIAQRTPIILVPRDILRPLPIARDWDSIAEAADHNDALRHRVSKHISHIWKAKSRRDKSVLRTQSLRTKEAFQTLLDTMQSVPKMPYDCQGDPDGLLRWATIGKEFAQRFPLSLLQPKHDVDAAHAVVKQIIVQFQQLVEQNGLNKELYKSPGQPRHESTAQRLFFAVAASYCEAQGLDLSPEVDSGSGKIDFKFSRGHDCRVLVEVKLSTNSKLVAGYTTQLEVYKSAEKAMRAFYLVIDVGRMARKADNLRAQQTAAKKSGKPLSDLMFVDGRIKKSASKR